MDFGLLKTWQRFEEFCRVLLNLEFENILGTVPNRGDRGIDSFSVSIDGKLQIYQFKFLPGKLTQSGRQQIKESLKTGSRQNPVLWHLITPAEFSMEDWEWWESLKGEYSDIDFQIWNNDKLEALVIKHQENLKFEFIELFSTAGLALQLGKTLYENILDDLITLKLKEANIQFISVYTEVIEGDLNCWKNGHFRMEDVHSGYDARRAITSEILSLIKSNPGVIVLGRAHYGKSVILMRIAFEALERGYVTLYTDNLSANSIVLGNILEHTIHKTNLKVLFIVDNITGSNITEIFKCFNNFKLDGRVKFLLASRKDEFEASKLVQRPYDQREVNLALQMMREVNLSFNEDDAYQLLKRSTQLWNVNLTEDALRQLAQKFHEVSEADPLTFTCMIISYLNNRLDPNNLTDPFEYLEYDFNEKIGLLNSSPHLWNVAIQCLFIGGLGIRMVPEILVMSNITPQQIIQLSDLGILFKNGEYKVRHGRWAIEFLLYICKKKFNLNFDEFNKHYAINSLIQSLSLQLNIDTLLILFARFSSIVGEVKFKEMTENWVQLIKVSSDLSDVDKANLYCYGYGNFYLSSNDNRTAIEWYKKAIDLQPNHYASWNNRGNAHHALEQYSLAKSCYDEAIKIHPKDSEPHYNKAKVLNDEGRDNDDPTEFEEALKHIELAISFDPAYQWNYFEKGNTLINLKREADAVVFFYKTLSINPRNSGAWLNLTWVLYLRKIYGYMKPILDLAEKIDPQTPELWYLKALLEKEIGSSSNVEQLILKAIELDPTESKYHTQMGILLLQKSDFKTSFKFLMDAHILDDKDVATLGNLSICSIFLKKKCDALVFSAKTYLNLNYSKSEDVTAFRNTLAHLCLYIASVSNMNQSVSAYAKIFDPDLLLVFLSTYIDDKECTMILLKLFNLI